MTADGRAPGLACCSKQQRALATSPATQRHSIDSNSRTRTTPQDAHSTQDTERWCSPTRIHCCAYAHTTAEHRAARTTPVLSDEQM